MQIESKIFFCDAKANSRGLYLKISEKGTNRERSTIIVPGQSLPWFRELFNYYATTEPSYALVPCTRDIVKYSNTLCALIERHT